MTLHCTTSDVEFEKEIAEAEATTRSKDQSDIDDDPTDKKHGYDMDICQLLPAEIAALGVQRQAKIQSMMIAHEIIKYHANHLLLFLCE